MSNVHTFTRAGIEMSVEIDGLSPEIIAQLIRHGLTQKIGDAAANAKSVAAETGISVSDAAKGMMEKVRDSLLAGDWGVTREGNGGVSEETAIQRKIVREMVKTAFGGSKGKKWAEFTAKSETEQTEFLDSVWAKNATKLKEKFDAEKTRREIVRKAAQSAKNVSVEIDF